MAQITLAVNTSASDISHTFCGTRQQLQHPERSPALYTTTSLVPVLEVNVVQTLLEAFRGWVVQAALGDMQMAQSKKRSRLTVRLAGIDRPGKVQK